jgi:hypothetical protein
MGMERMKHTSWSNISPSLLRKKGRIGPFFDQYHRLKKEPAGGKPLL